MSFYLFFAAVIFTIMFATSAPWREINGSSLADLLAIVLKVGAMVMMITGWLLYFQFIGVITLHFGA